LFQCKESSMFKLIHALIVTLVPALVWAGPVDINTADAATIAKELQGIGLSRAQAIVAYREKNGAFRSADDLRKIKGIGAKVLDRNRANIKVDAKSEGTPRKKTE
jgi:competence protein ComEA